MISLGFRIRQIGLQILRFVLSLCIPIRKDKIMFESFPDYSDNARAFSDYLIEHNTNLHLIWSVRNKQSYVDSDRISFIQKDGGNSMIDRLIFIYHTVSSQYLISTHGSFKFASKRRQIYVCCWHGMPLKRIAQWQSAGNQNYIKNARYILSTSSFYKPIIAKCFGRVNDDVISTGYPRNDWLFQESDVLSKLGVVKGNRRLVLYLPTFRKAKGSANADSNTDSFRNRIFDFTSEEKVKQLNLFLERISIMLIVKPHPSEANQLSVVRMSNLLIIPHSVFIDRDIQLNNVLHYADALITDFSGAFIDYLNLNRPIGFTLADYEEYKGNRGFVFDNPLDFMPGMKIFNEDDLKSFCEDIAMGVDRFADDRIRLHDVYNDLSDGYSCERLASFLNIICPPMVSDGIN